MCQLIKCGRNYESITGEAGRIVTASILLIKLQPKNEPATDPRVKALIGPGPFKATYTFGEQLMANQEMQKKTALITGATSGIGHELAKVFAENGYSLIIVARSEGELAKTAAELTGKYSVRVDTIAKDLFEKDSAFEVVEEVKRLGVTVDALVNNAAQGCYGKFLETDLSKELAMLQLNIGAYIILTKHFLAEMTARGEGKILNVASIASKVPGPYQAVYHGTKAFIHSFSEAVRAEVEGSGVTITSLLPGATDTDFFHKANMEDSKILEMGLSDPAKVARDGFKALMDGDDMIVSGMKWKAQVAASNMVPDSALAKMMLKQQGPKSEPTKTNH